MKKVICIILIIALFLLPCALAGNDYSAINGSEVLKRGMRGSQVRRVQQALINLGYLNGRADGSYGSQTESAVQRFQWKNGITQNGVATMFTQAKLFGSSAVYAWDSTASFNTPSGAYGIKNTDGYASSRNQATVTFDFVNRDSRTVEAICIYYIALDGRNRVVGIGNSEYWMHWYFGMNLQNQGTKSTSQTLNFTSSQWNKIRSIMCVVGEIAYYDGTIAIPMNAREIPYYNSGYTLMRK